MQADLIAERTRIRTARAALPHEPLRAFAERYACTILPVVAAGVLLASTRAPWSWVLFGLVAGFTQNALGILTHEASHYFLHRDRRANDILANWLVCLPVFNSVERYRDEHFVHHRECCGHTDPYFGLYGPYDRRWQVVGGFVSDVVGLTAVRSFLARQRFVRRPASERFAFLVRLCVVQAPIAAALWAATASVSAYVVLWVLPLATIPFVVNRIRTFVEHHADSAGKEASRATIPNAFEYFLIAPYGYSFHFEHHLMPDVPYYQLSWVHAELARGGFQFGPDALAPHGYLRTFVRLFRGLR
jgi:fatty acid desaturase